MAHIPMKGDERWDPVEGAKTLDAHLPQMLRDSLRHRHENAETSKIVAEWDRQIAEIEKMCRQRGIDTASIFAEFEQRDPTG